MELGDLSLLFTDLGQACEPFKDSTPTALDCGQGFEVLWKI